MIDLLFPVVAITGPVLIGTGLWLIHDFDRRVGETVAGRVEIVEQRVEDGDNGKVYRPVFRVVGGPHAGLLHEGEYAMSPPLHRVGDVVDGLVSPGNGVVFSDAYRRRARLFGQVFLAIGAGALLVGVAGLGLQYFDGGRG